MLFHSLQFALFFTLAFFGHWLLLPHRRTHLVFLAAMSIWFYAVWNAYYVVLIFVSTTIDFIAAERIHATEDPRRRKAWLLASLIGNLGLLGTFKYYNFFIGSIHDLTGFIGLPIALPALQLLLPVGISFYTFQSLSYTIDVYRRKITPARSYLELFVFVIFFPQLVAGPIVRAAEFLPQLARRPTLSRSDVGAGLYRIVWGLIQKVVMADSLARTIVDPTFAAPGDASGVVLLLAVVAVALQVYGDFAGYSNIAIGTARLLGYHFPENFRSPFRSTSFREFFVRWHITLGTWVRDYLYIPLGGGKKGRLRGYLNLVLTMALTGLWHGASWRFALWGLYLGVMLFYRPFRSDEHPSWIRVWFWRAVTFALILPAFLLFRAETLTEAVAFGHRLLSELLSWNLPGQIAGVLGDPRWRASLLVLGFALATHLLPDRLKDRIEVWFSHLSLGWITLAAATGIGLVVATYGSQAPFVYFQF